MDNVRGVCGCPVAGLTPHELFDAAPVVAEHSPTDPGQQGVHQPAAQVQRAPSPAAWRTAATPRRRTSAWCRRTASWTGEQVNGFNVLVGGKQGSGGYTPAQPLDVFVRPEDAAALCGHVVGIFRDHGYREQRNKARLAFLIEDRGIGWFRAELERRWGRPLLQAGPDLRKNTHVDHLGIHPQKRRGRAARPEPLLRRPAGAGRPHHHGPDARRRRPGRALRQRRHPPDRAAEPGHPQHPGGPHRRLDARSRCLQELPFDPSPIMRGLVACVGIDYCHMALIETKGWAIEVARELEKRTAGKKIAPLTIHWSGCSAGCGMHQVSTIGLQGCRSRVNGKVVDAAHVCVKGQSGPQRPGGEGPDVRRALRPTGRCPGAAGEAPAAEVIPGRRSRLRE